MYYFVFRNVTLTLCNLSLRGFETQPCTCTQIWHLLTAMQCPYMNISQFMYFRYMPLSGLQLQVTLLMRYMVSCPHQPCSAPADPLWLLLWDQSSSLAFFFSGCLLFFPALLSFPKNTTFSQMESRMTASWGRWGMLGGWGN